MIVPNHFPSYTGQRKIAIVGEAPGDAEVFHGVPFCTGRTPTNPYSGASGRLLAMLLSKNGIRREDCFLGNVCQHQPPGNKINEWVWNDPRIQAGITVLRSDLERFKPNVVLLLGNTALKLAMDPETNHILSPRAFKFKNADYRGSIMYRQELGYKFIPSYHPAYCLRSSGDTPLLEFDIRKAVGQSTFPELRLTERKCIIPTTLHDCLSLIQTTRALRLSVACDIEGYWNALFCVSFAAAGNDSFIVPFTRRDGTRVWNIYDEMRVWRALAELLEDPLVPKILQNSLYDRFALQYGHGIRIRNVLNDTMLQWWELYAELPKALDVQTSVFTDQPYYKATGKSKDDKTYYEYCCLDSAVTKEISDKITTIMPTAAGPTAPGHYALNMALLNPLLYMEVAGIRYDSLGAAQRRELLRTKMHEAQARLNALVGRSITSANAIFTTARELMGFKRATITNYDQLYAACKKEYIAKAHRLREITKQLPTLALIGEVEDLIGLSINTASTKTFPSFLYEELKLPTQYKVDKATGEHRVTADYEALLRLAKHCTRENDPTRLAIIHLAIEIRALDTRQQMLSIGTDNDGRIRCGYNVVGSDTGRVQCYTSPTGSGYALQTIPNYTSKAEAPGGVLGDRDLFLADEWYWLFQCDLKGADGWTVAAYSAMLGDSTMLDDYKAGIAPFDILTLKLRGVSVDFSDREALREARKAVKKDDWDRFAMKRVLHGANYLEGGPTISTNILKDSEGKMFLEPSECKRIRDDVFFARYPGVRLWHSWVGRRLSERPQLVAASGQVRKFFGRPDEILTKAVAFEPQANTTYATNLALYNLWTDPQNRITKTSEVIQHTGSRERTNFNGRTSQNTLRIIPVHQVHDALIGQFRKSDTDWAITKIKSWFNNPLMIAGQQIVIPFDGEYGPSWGALGEKHGGGKI